MKRAAWASGVTFGLLQACATVAPAPLSLPPRGAPLEERVVAFRSHVASSHPVFNGWEVRVGPGPVGPASVARPVLLNAPPAAEILRRGSTESALGAGLFGGGLALAMGSAVSALTYALRYGNSDLSLTIHGSVLVFGLGVCVTGALFTGMGQRRVPQAVEAYNRWLWDALDLPRVGRAAARTPHPALQGAVP